MLKTIYVPIDVRERLPEKQGIYPVIQNGEHHNRHFDGLEFWTVKGVTHWLEKQDMIIMSEEEYNQQNETAYNEGFHEGKSINY